jgi:hypothetical protein
MMEINDSGFARMVKKTGTPMVRRMHSFSLTPAAYVSVKALYQYQHWSVKMHM